MILTLEQQQAVALARARRRRAESAKPQTNMVEQSMSGVNEGIGNFLGLPVDAATGVLNLGIAGANAFIPNDEKRIQPIQNPVGGSGTMHGMMDPFISDVAPQTTAQRYGRRVGQEVGFGAPMALATAGMGNAAGQAARASMPAFMASSTASDVGAGLAGQTAQEVMPDNKTVQFIASLLGGVAGGGSVAAMTPRNAPTPSLDDVRAAEKSKWEAVQSNPATLTPQAEAEYLAKMQDQLVRDRATNPNLFPRANATLADIQGNPNRTLYGLEEDRRLVGRNVAGNADEAAVGVKMKNEIDDYLRSLDPSKVTGADPRAAVADTMEARALTARRSRAEEVTDATNKAETRAATSGTGGNEINATRQKIRALLDRETDLVRKGKRGGYTPDEIKAMEDIVRGTPTTNAARMFGRLAPTSGALPMMATGYGGMAGLGSAVMGGNLLFAAPFGAGAVGSVAKGVGESITKRQIEDLLKLILSGKKPEMSQARAAANVGRVSGLMSAP